MLVILVLLYSLKLLLLFCSVDGRQMASYKQTQMGLNLYNEWY